MSSCQFTERYWSVNMLLLRLEVSVPCISSPDRVTASRQISLPAEACTEGYPLISEPFLSVRLANVSAKKSDSRCYPNQGRQGRAQHLDASRNSRPGGQLPGLEACVCFCLALQALGSRPPVCLGCWGSKRVIDVYLKKRKGREHWGKGGSKGNNTC